jgi:two-component system, OmpR family, sensor kinase
VKAPSLHRRSVAATTATVACVLLATGLSVFLILRAHLEGDLTDLLTERSVTVRMLADDLSGEKLVAGLRDRGIRATVHTADGRALVSAPQRPQAAGRLPGSEEPPLAVMSTQIDLPDGDRATIAVARDGVDRALRRLAALEAAAVLLGSLAAAVLASRAARAALRPLEEVVAAAELTTAERTDKRLDPERTDTEVGRLAGAFDAMLDRLDEALHQVRTSDERSQRFLADAAHQLRGPIASAKVAAEAVLVAPRADEPAQECHLARVAAECGRAGELVADLLVLARLDQDSLSAREPVDVTTLVWQEASRTAELAPTLSLEPPKSLAECGVGSDGNAS